MAGILYYLGLVFVDHQGFCEKLCNINYRIDEDPVERALFEQFKSYNHNDQGEIFTLLPYVMKKKEKLNLDNLIRFWYKMVDCGFNPLKKYYVKSHTEDPHGFIPMGGHDMYPLQRVLEYDSDIKNNKMYELFRQILSNSKNIEGEIFSLNVNSETEEVMNTLFFKLCGEKLKINCLHALVDIMELYLYIGRYEPLIKNYINVNLHLLPKLKDKEHINEFDMCDRLEAMRITNVKSLVET